MCASILLLIVADLALSAAGALTHIILDVVRRLNAVGRCLWRCAEK